MAKRKVYYVTKIKTADGMSNKKVVRGHQEISIPNRKLSKEGKVLRKIRILAK